MGRAQKGCPAAMLCAISGSSPGCPGVLGRCWAGAGPGAGLLGVLGRCWGCWAGAGPAPEVLSLAHLSSA